MPENLVIYIFILTIINSLFIGYVVGKGRSSNNYQTTSTKSFFEKEKIEQNKKTISIDDTKFVGNIRTEGLEKKYENLGETKNSSENISGAINKLKNMKG